MCVEVAGAPATRSQYTAVLKNSHQGFPTPQTQAYFVFVLLFRVDAAVGASFKGHHGVVAAVAQVVATIEAHLDSSIPAAK